MEIESKALWDILQKLISLGGLQVALIAGAIADVRLAFGLPWQTAPLAVGGILYLSSTVIVLQTLAEKGLMNANGERSSFSVLLMQDIAVIPMLALLPLVAIAHGGDAHHDNHAHHDTMSLVEGLPACGVIFVTLGAAAAIVLAGMFLIPPLFFCKRGASARIAHGLCFDVGGVNCHADEPCEAAPCPRYFLGWGCLGQL